MTNDFVLLTYGELVDSSNDDDEQSDQFGTGQNCLDLRHVLHVDTVECDERDCHEQRRQM